MRDQRREPRLAFCKLRIESAVFFVSPHHQSMSGPHLAFEMWDARTSPSRQNTCRSFGKPHLFIRSNRLACGKLRVRRTSLCEFLPTSNRWAADPLRSSRRVGYAILVPSFYIALRLNSRACPRACWRYLICLSRKPTITSVLGNGSWFHTLSSIGIAIVNIPLFHIFLCYGPWTTRPRCNSVVERSHPIRDVRIKMKQQPSQIESIHLLHRKGSFYIRGDPGCPSIDHASAILPFLVRPSTHVPEPCRRLYANPLWPLNRQNQPPPRIARQTWSASQTSRTAPSTGFGKTGWPPAP